MSYELESHLNPNFTPNAHVLTPKEVGTVLTPRFDKFYQIHKSSSFSLKDIPWDQIDNSKLTDDDVNGVLAAMSIESHNPVYTETLLWMNREDHEGAAFTLLWGEQELQHYLGLRMYAEYSGRVSPEELEARLQSNRKGQWGREERKLTPVRAKTRTVMQEQVTGQFYQNFIANTEEPVLKMLLKPIAHQEFNHSNWYLEGNLIDIAQNPKAKEEIEDELLNFEMPGPSFMENYEAEGAALRKVAKPGVKDYIQALGKVKRLIGTPRLIQLLATPSYVRKLNEEWGMNPGEIAKSLVFSR